MKDDSERREQELWQSDRVLAAEAVIGPIAMSKAEVWCWLNNTIPCMILVSFVKHDKVKLRVNMIIWGKFSLT